MIGIRETLGLPYESSHMIISPGTKLGPYEVAVLIGEGGMDI
jgi:hypothetical protein